MLSLSHEDLVNCIKVLYPKASNIKGICYGISKMQQRAFLLGEEETNKFNQRLKRIFQDLLPITKALKKTIDENQITTPQELQSLVTQKIPYKNWYDVYAFLDGVVLYQEPLYHREVFDKNEVLLQLHDPIKPY